MIFTMPPVEVAGILAWILADLCREYWVGSGGGRALDIDVDPGSSSNSRLGEESGGVAGGSGEKDLDTGKKEGEDEEETRSTVNQLVLTVLDLNNEVSSPPGAIDKSD